MSTVRIKMRTSSAGPSGVMRAGEEYDVNPAVARAMVQGRYAELVDGSDIIQLETAAKRSSMAGGSTDEKRTTATANGNVSMPQPEPPQRRPFGRGRGRGGKEGDPS